MNKWQRLVAVAVFAYVAGLCLVWLLFWSAGSWPWQIDLARYLPRLGFALPLPFLIVLLLVVRLRRLLWTQLIAALLVLFPLMGLVLTWPVRGGAEKTLRVLSYNAASGFGGEHEIVTQIAAYSPDVVLMQELLGGHAVAELLKARYPIVQADGEFLIATRFPLRASFAPHSFRELRVAADASFDAFPGFVQYELDTPLGRLVLFNVHGASPRHQFYAARSGGIRRMITSGQLFSPRSYPDVQAVGELRTRQTQAFAAAARSQKEPVIIAGDTNLPGLSPPLRELSVFDDGFREAGFGFGYTFPSDRPFMRIDRVFASPSLRFAHFEVGCSRASDHRCVVADLARALP